MGVINHTKRSGFYSWPQFRILGIFAIIYGVYKLYTSGSSFAGLAVLSILVGILVNLMTKGIQLDFSRKRYREYAAILGLKYGKWIKLPDIDYISVFRQQLIKQGGMQSLSYQDKQEVIIVKLVVSENEHYDVASFKKQEDGMALGKLCAQKFNTKLLDYTNPDPKWVELTNAE
jgi:hypothetical protein